tara:strand:+ start:2856 stop:3005 length:150 start_codon:yes stop_codon:yes gene_type:complete
VGGFWFIEENKRNMLNEVYIPEKSIYTGPHGANDKQQNNERKFHDMPNR